MEDIDNWLMKQKSSLDLLKTELDGIQQNNGLVTVLTSNNPEEFPDALLDRPGRFHDVLEFELPDKGLRESMIKDWTGVKDFSKDEIKKLIEKTEDFSGAHIRELVDFAKMIVEYDSVDIKKALFVSLEKIVSQRELIARIRKENNETEEIDTKTLKEGRIISKSNRKLIKDAVEAINKSGVALVKLLEISEPSVDGDKSKVDNAEETTDSKTKVVKPKKVEEDTPVGADEIALRTLQKINKVSNLGLKKLKQKKK